MTLRCQNCGDEIPSLPEDQVEDGRLDEVVGHKKSVDQGFTVSEKDYYCNPTCFVEAFTEDEEVAE